MKKIIVVFLLAAVGLCAQSQQLNLGEHGKITLYLLDGWKFNVSDFGDRLMVSITPKADVNAGCSLTVRYPEEDHLDTKNRLREKVEVLGLPLADHSVEGKAVAKEFSLGTGYGFYCNFTDAELVGKPPEKDNFKTMSVGLVHLAPDVLVEVGISADGFKSEPYQLLLGMIEGMEYAPRDGRSR